MNTFEKVKSIEIFIEKMLAPMMQTLKTDLEDVRLAMPTFEGSMDEVIAVWNLHVSVNNLLKDLIPVEMEVRKTLFAMAFPEPVENTNTLELSHGWKLKAMHKFDRKIDEAAMPDILAELQNLGVNTDILIKYIPQLEMTNYRSMTEENRTIFNQCITTKPGSPSLELIAPKVKK